MLPNQVHQLLVFGSAFGAGMFDSVAGGLLGAYLRSRTSFATCLLAAQKLVKAL